MSDERACYCIPTQEIATRGSIKAKWNKNNAFYLANNLVPLRTSRFTYRAAIMTE